MTYEGINTRPEKEASMRQEGINTRPGGGAGVRNRLPRLAMAAVFLALVVAIFAASAGSAQSQTTTELRILYKTGDNIAVPGKLHPTETLAGPDGTEYPVFHDDSKAYFRIDRYGGSSLFSDSRRSHSSHQLHLCGSQQGLPIECNHGSREDQQPWQGARYWDLSEIIGLATSGPLTIELETMEGQPYTVSSTNNSICIVLHTLGGTIIGDDCTGGA